MVLYLRNKENKTILDLEVWVKTENDYSFVELRSVVDIKHYSELLLNNLDKKNKIIPVAHISALKLIFSPLACSGDIVNLEPNRPYLPGFLIRP